MTPADCSVIVVSWNTRDLLEACLASVREKAPQAETIVVDNGSADGSSAMVRLSSARPISWAAAATYQQFLGNTVMPPLA